MTTLRLILGDQLNPLHSWFAAGQSLTCGESDTHDSLRKVLSCLNR